MSEIESTENQESVKKEEVTPDVAAIEGLKNAKCVSKTMIVVATIPILLYFTTLRSDISDLKDQLVRKEIQLTQTTDNFNKLSDVISMQNAAIESTRQAAQAASEQSVTVAQNLKVKKKESEDMVNKILKAAKPKDCESSRIYLITGAEELRWSDLPY